MAQEAMPKTVNPVADLGQIDYRQNPSAGDDRTTHGVATYDNPDDAGQHAVQPWTDNTWQAYDEATDASRYRGINQPEQQAKLHLSPDLDSAAHGWSPELERQLAWERAVSGAPPS